MARLEKLGKPNTRKIYLRHGYPEPLFGVSFGDLNTLRKEIKIDHAVAEGLWASGNADARVLAAMVADPAKLTLAQADRWVKESGFRTLADYVGALAARTPQAEKLAQKWSRSTDSLARRAGHAVLGGMAKEGKPASEALSREILQSIERDIHTADIWSRYGMMYTLIGIGASSPALTRDAIAAAKRIGKVEFDPEDTNCKVPDPVPHIERTVAHQRKRGKAR